MTGIASKNHATYLENENLIKEIHQLRSITLNSSSTLLIISNVKIVIVWKSKLNSCMKLLLCLLEVKMIMTWFYLIKEELIIKLISVIDLIIMPKPLIIFTLLKKKTNRTILKCNDCGRIYPIAPYCLNKIHYLKWTYSFASNNMSHFKSTNTKGSKYIWVPKIKK